MKRLLKRLVRPFTRRLFRQVDQHIVDHLEATLGPFRSSSQVAIDNLRRDVDRSLPAVLSAVSTQNATARLRAREIEEWRRERNGIVDALEALDARLGRAEHRVEFVRREFLVESRYGPAAAELSGADTETRILRPELVGEGGKLRLNLGAGHLPVPGYLNIDSRPLDGIDIVCDIRHLPFDKDSVAEIYSAHFLEHFPVEELRRSLLPYLVSLLEDGGIFVAVVPDMETMVQECAAGRLSYRDFLEVTYGGQEYSGDFHFAGFTGDSLRELFEDCGLSNFSVRASARRNGLCYELEVEGIRLLSDPS